MSVLTGLTATAVTSTMAYGQSYHDKGINGVDAVQIEKRYGEDRTKRLRGDGKRAVRRHLPLRQV